MTCRRAFEADLAAVLHGEGTDAEFQSHYPGCPECAAEVAVWRELDATLRAGAPAREVHPDAAELLAFVDAPASLAASARSAIERHVTGCRMCADETRTLQRTDLGRLVDVPEPASGPAEPVPRRSDETPGWFRRVLWHPAVAYALVAVLLVPVVRDQLARFHADRDGVERRAAETAVEAERDAPAAPASRDDAALRDQLAAAPRPAADFAAKAASERLAASQREGQPKQEAEPAGAPPPLVMRKVAPAPREEDRGSARQFSDTLGGTALGAAQPASVVAIGPTLPSVVPLAVALTGPRLRVMLPPDVEEGPVDVRVRARAGGGEIFQHVAVRANAIELQIPPDWLAAGDYVVTVRPASRDEARARRSADEAVIGFTVRAPAVDGGDH